MSAEALQQAFFREMDKLRRGPKRIEPLDMAEVARKVGLPPHEAGQLRQERSILKVLLTIRSEERVMKTYPDSVIAIADGHVRLHMSV